MQNEIRLEAMPALEVYTSYAELDINSPTNQNESHVHKECEIYVNLSGDVDFEVENSIYHVRRGSVIITRPYEYHHCIYRSDRIHKHYWILLGGQSDDRLLELFYNRSLGCDNLINLSDEELGMLVGYLERLMDKRGAALDKRIALMEALRMLTLHERGEGEEISAELPSDVALALAYMDSHLCEEMSIERIAKKSFVSVNTLERHFREHMQTTPFAMIRKKRLIHSARLLRGGASVSEACEGSGFSDYSGYIATFRSFFGITPLQYKKKVEKQI